MYRVRFPCKSSPYPDLAELVMNKCTETNAGSSDGHGGSINSDSESFEVTYDYEFLEDFRDSEKTDPELSEKERYFACMMAEHCYSSRMVGIVNCR